MYPNPYAAQNYPPSYADTVPVLRHRGVPSPLAPGSASTSPLPPAYGFMPPAGSVPYQDPYQPPTSMSGQDEWITVRHGAQFPHGAVQAMDRTLRNNDQSTQHCYVALWENRGEPVFGRAWNNRGNVEAWFPHGGKEYHSGQVPSFKILTYRGPPSQIFRYAWVQVNQLNAMCQPVRQQAYSPVVISEFRTGTFVGELLGKANLSGRQAWVSYAGKEHPVHAHALDTSYVLCRVPL